MSDDDEESNSIEIDLITSFVNLQADDKNANSEAQGKLHSYQLNTYCNLNII